MHSSSRLSGTVSPTRPVPCSVKISYLPVGQITGMQIPYTNPARAINPIKIPIMLGQAPKPIGIVLSIIAVSITASAYELG